LLGAATALVVARPLYPSESAAEHGDGVVIVLLWFLVAALWLVGALASKRPVVRLGWTELAVVILVGWHGLSTLWAMGHGSPRPALNMFWEWVGLGLSFLLIRQLFITRRERRAILVIMIGLAAALSTYGVYQYAWELPAERARYWQDPDAVLREQGLWFEPGSRERRLFEDRLKSTEPMGTFALANSLAGFLVPWLVVAVGVAVAPLDRDGPEPFGWPVRWGYRIAGVAVVMVVAVCLVLTKSRSGLLAVLAGLGVAVPLCRPGARLAGWKLAGAMITGAALLVGVAVASGGWDVQVLTEAGKSLGYRLEYWKATGAMIAERPLVGCGPGNFRYAYTQYMLPEASEEVAEPHSFLLEVWATAGTPAMVALVAALACAAWAMLRRGRGQAPEPEPSGRDASPFVVGGAVLGFLVAPLAGSVGPVPPGIQPLVLGLLVTMVSVVVMGPGMERVRLPALLPGVAAAALLLNLCAAGGIGFPGVSGSLWLLVALGMNCCAVGPGCRLGRPAVAGALVVTLALAAAMVRTGYLPVVRAVPWMRRAYDQPDRAEEYLERAADADRWSAEPWKLLAELAFRHWRQEPSPGAFDWFETCAQKVLQLNPNSEAVWFRIGRWYWEAYLRTGRREHLERAVGLFAGAVKRYPNRSLHRALLAIALAERGDPHRSQLEARRALRLDELNPHADKDLPGELRRLLRRIASQKEVP